MTPGNHLGTVQALWRFPVKSMRGQKLETAYIDGQGLIGDRAFALLDVEKDQIVSAKYLRRFPDIYQFRATFPDEPVAGEPLPPVQIELPGGGIVSGTQPDVDEVLSAALGRTVRLIRVGDKAPVPYHDASPLSLLTESTLAHLRELRPESDFDVRRFRMNIIIDSDQPGFVENDWVDELLKLGSDLTLQVTRPNARCVMTTLAQDELPVDREIFATLVKYNRLEMENSRPSPCAGVYAQVKTAGVVKAGDAVQK